MSLRIHYFMHVPYEGLGFIEEWAHKHSHELSCTEFYEDEHKLPSIEDFDWLVIMGGSMSIYDEAIPWLSEEKQFILKAIKSGKKVIGICLGAQLIADVLGAKVYPNRQKEIGWWPVRLTEEGERHPLLRDLLSEFITFHWHGDMFDIPEGAVRLISSDVCENQAFVYKEQVLALQFHFETTEQSVSDIIRNSRHELVNAPFIQPENKMLELMKRYISENNERLDRILDRMLDL